jgi:hypothetical protein
LTKGGTRVLLLTFWDDAAVLKRFREAASHEIFKGDKGIGTPEKPLHRRDKNVTSWYLTVARFCLYLLDALHLNLVVARALTSKVDIVIFDRYIYDELANLSSRHWFTRIYVGLLLKYIPRPDVAYLLDADPLQARARKPEYPIDFLQTNRASYLALWKWSDSEQIFSSERRQVPSPSLSGGSDTPQERRSDTA